MTRAPAGWGITGDIEHALDTPRRAGTRQVAASRHRAAQIAYWLGTLRHVPSTQDIRDRWGVSRVTASRWRHFALSGGEDFVDTHNSKGEA